MHAESDAEVPADGEGGKETHRVVDVASHRSAGAPTEGGHHAEHRGAQGGGQLQRRLEQ